MSKLFSPQWTQELAELWNRDPKMVLDLSSIGFDAHIGFGFLGENGARISFLVSDGKVEQIAPTAGDKLDWDLRADEMDWKQWFREGLGLPKLAVATSSGRLQFVSGDYRRMLRTPNMARPFLRVFELMMQIQTD